MTENVAVFLDLDNLVIGARQANLAFHIDHILAYLKSLTNGRIVLRRAYGDSYQNRELVKELTAAGFITQANLSVNNFGKNLADMQITVDAMESLVDERPYHIYVLITGDQDFSPLVHALRKRDKHVIGIGVKHAASSAFASFCDQYLFYEDIIPTPKLDNSEINKLLTNALASLEKEMERVRASVLKQRLDELSQGGFSNSSYAEEGFRKFLARYPQLVQIEQEGTTTYVMTPAHKAQPPSTQLHLRYRTALKKKKLRIVPPKARLLILKEAIMLLQGKTYGWKALINRLVEKFSAQENPTISKNMINAVLLLAQKAQAIQVDKEDSLAQSTVWLTLKGDKAFQEALVLCDQVYLQHILALRDPFDIEEAALALYESKKHTTYLKRILPEPPNQQDAASN